MLGGEPGRPGAIEDLLRARPAPAYQLCACRLEEPSRGALRVRRQLCRAPQKQRSGGCTAPLSRPFRGHLQRACDVLVRTGGRGAEVPRASVGIEIGIERLGERGVGAAPVGRGGRVVGDRSDERMAKCNFGDECDEPACLRVRECLVP